ncbi:Oidioi.mRNA.OKI2018_I69.PAR.g12041.t1.cds [Oikopleura dioica]|uniref:Oidioi.mRNA.OKI2018_I69.PAR.g12041.t1.cds n=1 Tax=Oikopleura dioica TaxID=34765 RepID=A0ABN7RYW8_OIKDI|nr:Oidioi.mRNA.OKI2018_I69.PAR.g12041.t1.cds [Oikopleura dioica]
MKVLPTLFAFSLGLDDISLSVLIQSTVNRCATLGTSKEACVANVRTQIVSTYYIPTTCSFAENWTTVGKNSKWWGKTEGYGIIGCGDITNAEIDQGVFDSYANNGYINCWAAGSGQKYNDCVVEELEKGAPWICPGTRTAHFLVAEPGTDMYWDGHGGGYSGTKYFDTVGYCVGIDI